MNIFVAQAIRSRFSAAATAAGFHLIGSIFVAVAAAALVFGLWYPFPFSRLSGGMELFTLVIAIDVILGPVLTLVLFSPSKARSELVRDLTLVVVIQLCALGYGVWTVWQARPLFMVAEVDRFKVITKVALTESSILILPPELQSSFFSGPLMVAIREAKDQSEKNMVLFESLNGGRDYGERPDFYIPYTGDGALKSLNRSKPLEPFLEKFPDHRERAEVIAKKNDLTLHKMRYLPIVARQDWIALLNEKGLVIGYLKGDGF